MGNHVCPLQAAGARQRWNSPGARVSKRRVPEQLRNESGSEMTAKCVQSWLGRVGVKTLFIEPGGPWENGCCESSNGRLREEARVLLENWRREYNGIRPHGILGQPPRRAEMALNLHSTWTDEWGQASDGTSPAVGRKLDRQKMMAAKIPDRL